MSEQNTAPVQPNRIQRGLAFAKKHERKILVATTVASTGYAIILRSGVKAHNEFLKEHGLLEQFYQVETALEA